MTSPSRPCPICNSSVGGFYRHFPWSTFYNKTFYSYYKCQSCFSVFVDPVPDAQTLKLMYSKTAYHDPYYRINSSDKGVSSASFLRSRLFGPLSVLDYGCGVGTFLSQLKSQKFIPCGVEFDLNTCEIAHQNSHCLVMNIKEFEEQGPDVKYDVICLRDVLEHLPSPADTMNSLLCRLRPGGYIFVEGPLEANHSLVYWTSKGFDFIMTVLGLSRPRSHPPYHLYFTNSCQQLNFFFRLHYRVNCLHWRVYETGWPYANNGFMRSIVANLAIHLARLAYFGLPRLGNRFCGLFQLY